MSGAVSRVRGPLVAVAGAALVAPLVLLRPGPCRGRPVHRHPLTFTVEAGGRTCVVDADLYRPAGADADRPAPAVLATNGFGGSKSDGSTDAIGKAFAERGYVGLVYSGLGFGGSGCLITLDDPAIDGKAAGELIDFLGEFARPTTGPRPTSSPGTPTATRGSA